MKSNTSPRPHQDSLRRRAQGAASASAKHLVQIENIMRDEIFHSTLDWQTREQLADAVPQSFARLNEDRDLYDLDHACRLAMFQKMRTESSLRKENTPGSLSEIADAVAKYENARIKLFARLDETTPN